MEAEKGWSSYSSQTPDVARRSCARRLRTPHTRLCWRQQLCPDKFHFISELYHSKQAPLLTSFLRSRRRASPAFCCSSLFLAAFGFVMSPSSTLSLTIQDKHVTLSPLKQAQTNKNQHQDCLFPHFPPSFAFSSDTLEVTAPTRVISSISDCEAPNNEITCLQPPD